MSSNNQLIIRKEAEDKFVVYHNLCVDNEFKFEEDDIIGWARNLEKAVEVANEFMSKNLVEYGMRII